MWNVDKNCEKAKKKVKCGIAQLPLNENAVWHIRSSYTLTQG